jgi:peptidoglycan/LPS O-acetylase OafA/YrhL
MIYAMSNWNISGDTLTVEPRERRSPTRWLHQHSLRIAVVLGLAEAVFAWATGHRLLLLVIGVLAVVVYLNVRRRLPEVIRRPLWIVVMAQAIGGLVLPFVYLATAMFFIVGSLLLIVLALVMLGDRMRR